MEYEASKEGGKASLEGGARVEPAGPEWKGGGGSLILTTKVKELGGQKTGRGKRKRMLLGSARGWVRVQAGKSEGQDWAKRH
jgi:hypothetical protein